MTIEELYGKMCIKFDEQEARMEAKFATKDDLKALESRIEAKFATKDDLKALESRIEAKFATKDDLKNFATKDDLNCAISKLTQEISDEIKADMEFLYEKIMESKVN